MTSHPSSRGITVVGGPHTVYAEVARAYMFAHPDVSYIEYLPSAAPPSASGGRAKGGRRRK